MGAERNFDLRLRMDGERRRPFRDIAWNRRNFTVDETHASRPSFNRVLEKKREGGREERSEGKRKRYEKASGGRYKRDPGRELISNGNRPSSPR